MCVFFLFLFLTGTSTASSCNHYLQFECNNHECINRIWACDNYPDCSDGSDESPALDCSHHTCNQKTHFQCRSGQCIPRKWLCDAWSDCSDGDDERCFPSVQDTMPKSNRI